MAEGLTTNLRLELDRTNHLFNKWTSNYSDWLVKQQNDYDRVMEECSCTINTLQQTDQQLEESRVVNNAIKEQQRKEMEQVYQQNESYRRQLSALENQLQHFAEEEIQSSQRLQKIRQDHDLLRQKMEQSLQDLTHGLRHYAKLGLEFQKAEGDAMRFIFTQIDPQIPHQQFFFTIFVDEQNMYQLIDTQPTLPSTPCLQLLQQLNETNSIGKFVYQMRCLFVQAVKSSSAFV
jgi:DNA repair exonuclease SbcCD ATPase subunit